MPEGLANDSGLKRSSLEYNYAYMVEKGSMASCRRTDVNELNELHPEIA